MAKKEFFDLFQKSLKLLEEVEESDKQSGLEILDQLCRQNEKIISEFGYNLIILKELVKMAQFETGPTLRKSLNLLETYYFDKPKHSDELAETLIYRVARSNDRDVCQMCLDKISALMDYLDDGVAKHSKQLLKLADLNDMPNLNPIIVEILEKLETKLPKRKLST